MNLFTENRWKMKALTLELKKKILIREYKDIDECRMIKSLRGLMPSNGQKLLCKGSELTEDMLFNIVIGGYCSTNGKCLYKSYNSFYDDECFNYALESFISVIEAQGYYWGENPILNPAETNFYMPSINESIKLKKRYNEAESKTFNPEKTLIFEIL